MGNIFSRVFRRKKSDEAPINDDPEGEECGASCSGTLLKDDVPGNSDQPVTLINVDKRPDSDTTPVKTNENQEASATSAQNTTGEPNDDIPDTLSSPLNDYVSPEEQVDELFNQCLKEKFDDNAVGESQNTAVVEDKKEEKEEHEETRPDKEEKTEDKQSEEQTCPETSETSVDNVQSDVTSPDQTQENVPVEGEKNEPEPDSFTVHRNEDVTPNEPGNIVHKTEPAEHPEATEMEKTENVDTECQNDSLKQEKEAEVEPCVTEKRHEEAEPCDTHNLTQPTDHQEHVKEEENEQEKRADDIHPEKLSELPSDQPVPTDQLLEETNKSVVTGQSVEHGEPRTSKDADQPESPEKVEIKEPSVAEEGATIQHVEDSDKVQFQQKPEERPTGGNQMEKTEDIATHACETDKVVPNIQEEKLEEKSEEKPQIQDDTKVEQQQEETAHTSETPEPPAQTEAPLIDFDNIPSTEHPETQVEEHPEVPAAKESKETTESDKPENPECDSNKLSEEKEPQVSNQNVEHSDCLEKHDEEAAAVLKQLDEVCEENKSCQENQEFPETTTDKEVTHEEKGLTEPPPNDGATGINEHTLETNEGQVKPPEHLEEKQMTETQNPYEIKSTEPETYAEEDKQHTEENGTVKSVDDANCPSSVENTSQPPQTTETSASECPVDKTQSDQSVDAVREAQSPVDQTSQNTGESVGSVDTNLATEEDEKAEHSKEPPSLDTLPTEPVIGDIEDDHFSKKVEQLKEPPSLDTIPTEPVHGEHCDHPVQEEQSS